MKVRTTCYHFVCPIQNKDIINIDRCYANDEQTISIFAELLSANDSAIIK